MNKIKTIFERMVSCGARTNNDGNVGERMDQQDIVELLGISEIYANGNKVVHKININNDKSIIKNKKRTSCYATT